MEPLISFVTDDAPRKAFYAALAKAQGAIEGAIKGNTNPAFRSKYADLGAVWDACREHLSANGIAVLQKPVANHGERITVSVQTILTHSEGHAEAFPPLELPVSKPDAQGIGSAITYGRRYSLMAAVGIAPEDDDGNAAANAPTPAARHAGVRTNGKPTASASKPQWQAFLDKLHAFTDPDACQKWFDSDGVQHAINEWPKGDSGDWAELAADEYDAHMRKLYARRAAAE